MKPFTLTCLSLCLLISVSACGPVIVPPTPIPVQDVAYHLAWSPDDRWLAASGTSGLYLLDTQTYKQKAFFSDAKNAEITFGSRLMAATDGETIQVWDLSDDRPLFIQHAAPINFQSVAISRDDKLLVTGEQKHFRVWSMPDGALLADIPAPGFVSNATFKDDGTLVVVIQYKALIQTWDVKAQKLLHSFEIPRDVTFFSMSRDGKILLVDYNDAGFQLWDIPTGKPQLYYRDAISGAGWERLSANDRFAATWGYANEKGSGLSVWDLSDGTRVHEFLTPVFNGDGWRGAALNSDGSRLAASDNTGNIYFYKVAGGETKGRFHLP